MASDKEKFLNGVSTSEVDEDGEEGETESLIKDKRENGLPKSDDRSTYQSSEANHIGNGGPSGPGEHKSSLASSAATSPDADDSKKEEDVSRTVKFADDIEVYDLSSKDATPITVSLDKPTEYAEEQNPNTVTNTDASQDPAVLPVSGEQDNTDNNLTNTSKPRPADLSLPQSLHHDARSEAVDTTAHGESTGPKHFDITGVSESALNNNAELDNKASEDRPVLEKHASTVSDGAHSLLSQNQDTIGPLDNPSFLKRLQYSVSQAVDDDGGFGGTSNLDLTNFQGVVTTTDLDSGWAWVVLFAACCSLALTGATTYTAGVLMPAILDQIDPDITKASWIGAVHVSVMCMSGPFVGAVLSRLGAKWTSFLAGLILSGGLLAASFAPSIIMLIFTHGLISGVGSGFILNTMFVVVGQYFNRYRGLACGLLATGSGAGMLAGGNVLAVLFSNFGLRGTYLLWSGITLHSLIFALLLRASPEEQLRDAEKKMAKDPNFKALSQQDLPSGHNSMMSGLNSVYSSDQHSIFSGRTNYSRRLQRYPSKLSKGDLSVAPLLKNVLHREMSKSTYSIKTNRSHKSMRSNTNIPSSPTTTNKFVFGPASGQADNLSAVHTPSPGTTPTTNSPLNPSPLAAQGDQVSPPEKNNTQNFESHYLSGSNIATIPEHESLGTIQEQPDANRDQPPASPADSRAPSEMSKSFRRRYMSGVSQAPSFYTSIGRLSHRPSIREQLQRNDLDNESLASTLVSHLQPQDALVPRYQLGSRSIPAMMGSIASFPTALAIVKDDLQRIEGQDEIKKMTLKDHLISLLDSLRLLRNKPFLVFILSCMFWALGDSAFFMYLPAYAVMEGSTSTQASSLYTGVGFGSMCGRFFAGLIASDSGIGPILLHIGCLSICGFVVALSPLLMTEYFSQMLCAGLFGLYSGSLVPLSSLITIELLGIGELGLGFGFLSMFQGVGYLVGPPLGGIVIKEIGYQNGFIFAGLVLVGAGLFSMVIAILLQHAGTEEDDLHDSFDDLERALRRISDTESEGEDSDMEPSEDDHQARRPFYIGSFHGSHHHSQKSAHGASFKKKDEHVVVAGGDAPPASETETSQEPVHEETELETIAEEA